MVMKMMKWRAAWQSKKFKVRIGVKSGVILEEDSASRYSVEIKWKGAKGGGISLRKSVRRNFTNQLCSDRRRIVRWDKEFRCSCAFSPNKEGLFHPFFHPWEITFTLFNCQ